MIDAIFGMGKDRPHYMYIVHVYIHVHVVCTVIISNPNMASTACGIDYIWEWNDARMM